MFRRELIDNRALTEQAGAFHPPYPERIGDFWGGQQTPTGAIVREDGSVLFRLYAPGMDRAEAVLTAFPDVQIDMIKNGEGFFEGVLPYSDRWRGPQDVRFYLDGTLFLHPQMPAHYRSFRQVNFVEIPDPESEMILLRGVPHGQVVREVFYSRVRGSWQRINLYLPPQYRAGGEYPVLYLQHGLTENENEWIAMGKAPYILDNLLADGKCVPFIVVMCDGMERLEGEGYWDFTSFGQMLLEEVIPFVEANYRIRAEKSARALAGLSMGSEQASVIGLTHPELFGALGMFSGFVRMDTKTPFFSCPHLRALRDDPDYIRANYDVFFRSIGEKDVYLPVFLEDRRHLTELGCSDAPCWHEIVYDGLTHDWGAFRRALRDFAQLIFRPASPEGGTP
ncbi:MAG: hypothetical protein J6K32_06555 [Clostridia bacterium]|nr:hypothetical protein [Clostridia bacterium]